jgi:hypothetical protein
VTARDLGTHGRGECLVEAKHAARAHERVALVQAGHGQGRGSSIQAGRVVGGHTIGWLWSRQGTTRERSAPSSMAGAAPSESKL